MIKNFERSVISASLESYVLDYPNKDDLAELFYHISHEAAMAEIYFQDDKSDVLEEQTISLINGRGKMLQKDYKRCDVMLVLRDNKKVIGFIEIRLHQNSETLSQLYSLFVSESYRRKGLSNLLMVHGLNFLVNSRQTHMTVSPTAASLTVYNKFGFYPPEFEKDKKSLEFWFAKSEEQRLEQLQDEFSEYLMMDLGNKWCCNAFEGHCKKVSENFPLFEISDGLKRDLSTNVFDWRKKIILPNLSQSDLGVLNKADVSRKRKATVDPSVTHPEYLKNEGECPSETVVENPVTQESEETANKPSSFD
ncbi:mycothiol synthase [Legionella wadsworthii]|uniref:Mycothiol synthase n=1 Tax=Legionella wadsworthii TaxID=28088 RepID=A0A378LRW9_9GAMM|nr:GNAT family N-acetyltransferase [Legionella wadsworthii]STY28572.1 mycothiol synthase [Legionella wadsworthii]